MYHLTFVIQCINISFSFYHNTWGYKDIPKGWLEYPFRFDIDIVSRIIHQHLENFPIVRNEWDGSYIKGFIMKCIDTSMDEEENGIKNPFYGIIYFKPYTCFYAK